MASNTERERFRGLRRLLAPGLLALAACAAPAEREGHMLHLSWGESETDPDDSRPLATTRVGLGYRFGEHTRWALVPSLELTLGSDDSVFLTGEVRKHLWLSERWVLTPSTGCGAFEDGDVLRLGGTLEFRSGAELAYRFPNGMRLGVALLHISNAGIYDVNPGTNEILIAWTIPISR